MIDRIGYTRSVPPTVAPSLGTMCSCGESGVSSFGASDTVEGRLPSLPQPVQEAGALFESILGLWDGGPVGGGVLFTGGQGRIGAW